MGRSILERPFVYGVLGAWPLTAAFVLPNAMLARTAAPAAPLSNGWARISACGACCVGASWQEPPCSSPELVSSGEYPVPVPQDHRPLPSPAGPTQLGPS